MSSASGGSGSQEEWLFPDPSRAGVSIWACNCYMRLGVAEKPRCPTKIHELSLFPE